MSRHSTYPESAALHFSICVCVCGCVHEEYCVYCIGMQHDYHIISLVLLDLFRFPSYPPAFAFLPSFASPSSLFWGAAGLHTYHVSRTCQVILYRAVCSIPRPTVWSSGAESLCCFFEHCPSHTHYLGGNSTCPYVLRTMVHVDSSARMPA